jgi:hypothetical protein
MNNKGKATVLGPGTTGRVKKEKQKTQKPAMQSIMVMGPTGKTHMEKRPW